MTYRELRDKLNGLSEEQLDKYVMYFDGNEGDFYNVESLSFVSSNLDCSQTSYLNDGDPYFYL